jgi:hypothetical protein
VNVHSRWVMYLPPVWGYISLRWLTNNGYI